MVSRNWVLKGELRSRNAQKLLQIFEQLQKKQVND